MTPVYRRVVSLAEPGAAAPAMLALTAAEHAIAYHVNSRTVGIGKVRLDDCSAHSGSSV